MAKRGPKVKYPEGFKNVQVDIGTYDRLRHLAAIEGLKLGPWLRKTTREMLNSYKPNWNDEDNWIANMLDEDILDSGEVGYFNNLEQMTELDRESIQKAIENDPDVKEVGYWKKDRSGNWIFNYHKYYQDNPINK